MTRIGTWFQNLTLAIALLGICTIILTTLAELVARSAGWPLAGAADVAAYALCVALVAAMPHVTRQGAQIAVTLLPEMMSPRSQRRLRAGVETLAAVAAVVICILCIQITLRQYGAGARTVAVLPIPRWVVSALLAYGFATSGVMHLLNAVDAAFRPRDPIRSP